MKIFKDWKTTVSGIGAFGSLCGSVAAYSGQLPALAPYAPYLLLASFICGSVKSYFTADKPAGDKPAETVNQAPAAPAVAKYILVFLVVLVLFSPAISQADATVSYICSTPATEIYAGGPYNNIFIINESSAG